MEMRKERKLAWNKLEVGSESYIVSSNHSEALCVLELCFGRLVVQVRVGLG